MSSLRELPGYLCLLNLPRIARCAVAARVLGLIVLLLCGCGQKTEYPNRPIALICPWGAGGGTDRVSRQIAVHLEQELGVPVNVINATGGKGVTGHSRGLRAQPDGYTLTTITLELNMLHWITPAQITYQDCTPLAGINEDAAALFVRADSPWAALPELAHDVQARPGKLTASGTATGGAWHLALAGWLRSMDHPPEDVRWISSTGANPSLLELAQGGVDMVCCSLPEARTLLDGKEVRALGVMSEDRVKDFPDVPTFKEQGFNWTLTGWRGLAVPQGTPQPVVEKLVNAVERVVTGQTVIENGGRRTTFPQFMRQEHFDNTCRGPVEFKAFLADNDAKFGKLLGSEEYADVSAQRFGPMLFPRILAIGLAVVFLLLIGRAILGKPSVGSDKAQPAESDKLSRQGVVNLAAVLLAIAVYALVAETVGFILTAAVLLLLLMWLLGTRLVTGVVVTLLFVPTVYQIFAHGLRVPLPQGWLGW